jgi:hypothetical protein
MRVTVDFMRGPCEGSFTFDFPLKGPAVSDDVMDAVGFYALTQGVVGKGTIGASPAQLEIVRAGGGREAIEKSGTRGCRYRVTAREEHGDHVKIRAEYFGPGNIAPRPDSS